MNLPHAVLCFSLVALVSTAAGASEISHITHVTLYPGSATIERTAHVAAGSRQLQIRGLPAGFDLRTIRIEADPGIHLGDFTVRDIASTDAVNPRQAELEKKVQDLDDQIGTLDIERKSAELVTGYLGRLGDNDAASGARSTVQTGNLGATLEAIRRGGTDAYSRIQQVGVKKRLLQAQKKALESDLGRIMSLNHDTRSLDLSLAADRGGDVRISYQVSGPGWQPTYRAQLNTSTGRMGLSRQALIAQNSGEDWQDVALTLSTGRPNASVKGPAPIPWTLYLQPPVQAEPMAMMAPAPAPVLAERKTMVSPSAPLFDVAEIQSGFSTEFEVPVKISLPSDGRKITIQLSQTQLEMSQRVQIIPRRSTTAYLLAETERPQGVWLPGDIQLYRDRSYVGTTHWNPQEGRKLELPFGEDDLISVRVTHPESVAGSAGLIGTRREQQLKDIYSVVSRHQQAVDLLVLEPSPVSTDKDIRVEKDFDPRPTEENWEKQNGVMAWKVHIEPAQEKTFTMKYRLTWPEDAHIHGLP